MCEQCVFAMDHHCPWIANCIGLDNRRYFLLFVLYLQVFLFYMLISMQVISHHHVYAENKDKFDVLFRFDTASSFVLITYNVWTWMLTFMGSNTIEVIDDVCSAPDAVRDD